MSTERSFLRTMLSPATLIRLAIAVGAAVGLWLAISYWIADRTSIHLENLPGLDRPVDLLAPQWLLLISVVPAFYLLRIVSLTERGLVTDELKADLPPDELLDQVEFLTPAQIAAASEVLAENWGPMVADA